MSPSASTGTGTMGTSYKKMIDLFILVDFFLRVGHSTIFSCPCRNSFNLISFTQDISANELLALGSSQAPSHIITQILHYSTPFPYIYSHNQEGTNLSAVQPCARIFNKHRIRFLTLVNTFVNYIAPIAEGKHRSSFDPVLKNNNNNYR